MEEKSNDFEALENFIVGNVELEKLEAMLDRFNIFEAVGITWQEKYHSNFLAFLLDPNESHGMGDAFVKRFLQRVVKEAPNTIIPAMPIESGSWDFERMGVRREWQWIDIFLLDEKNRLAVIIENKIWSGEHSDQLSRYYEAVRKEYPKHKIFALYLTPNGDEPSHSSYLPADYRMVCEILDELVESQATVAEPDARTLIKHYTEMLRRHIVGDHEVERLSREIYAKHSRAIDLIVKHQYKSQQEIRDQIEQSCIELINEQENFSLTQNRKSVIHFDIRYWRVPGMLFWFEFWNSPKSLELRLLIGPGSKEVRQRLFQMVRNNSETFASQLGIGGKWSAAYIFQLLEESFYSGATDEEREDEIRKNWDDFLKNDLPRIDAALKKEAWIWESEESETPSRRSDRFTWGEGDIQILNHPEDEPKGDEGER